MSTYNPAIPQPPDFLSVSQGQLLENFATLDTAYAIDHVAFSVATNQGMHKKISFQAPLGADPGLTGTMASVYTKAVGGLTQLFYQNSSAVVQITSAGGGGFDPSTGSGTLPNGLQIRSGTCGSNGSGFTNTFITPFPTACLSVVMTGGNVSQTTNVQKPTNITASGFVGRSPQGESGFYIAIGY